jgi:alpha,alpha-trehalose phosphorylase
MMQKKQLIEEKVDSGEIVLNETLFHTANGYIGIRGNFEEGVGAGVKTIRGSYINAFYDTEPINYEEKFSGYAEYNQTILNVIDSQSIELFLDDEKFSMFEGELIDYRRELDFDSGTVSRNVHWRSPLGKEVKIRTERFASFHTLELFMIRYSVESVNFSGKVKLVSILDGNVSNISSEDDPRLRASNGKNLNVAEISGNEAVSYISCNTKSSNLSMSCSMSHKKLTDFDEYVKTGSEAVRHSFETIVEPGNTCAIEKYSVYTDSRRHENLIEENLKINKIALENGFSFYSDYQNKFLADFWENADVIIEGDEKLQEGIRFNIFQLLQSVGKDRWSNIAAKGLSGEGYEGHYFWDTEIYIFPLFLYTDPSFAKNLLMFRYNTLDAARKRARDMAHPKGALYPWRTINGDECSGFFPAGTAQYHINTDVAYSIIQYLTVTEDYDFLADYAAEILFETARVMYDIGAYNSDGKFCINEVTGPDEYSCCVNNNYYTNVMTKYLFEYAAKAWNILQENYSEKLDKLAAGIAVTADEIKAFSAAAENMFIAFDEKLQIHPQDDSFLQKKKWDLKSIPKDKFPLLLHYHPLVLYRHQVVKQADTVLAHFLREEETTLDIIRNDFNYYEKVTTHDSSLSTCIHSIIASRLGEKEKAYNHFMHTARTDLDNLHGNSPYGIHTACMGGAWNSIVFGFAGMRVIKGNLHFHPSLPDAWKKLSFKILYKNRRLNVTLCEGGDIDVEILSGEPISIYVNDSKLTLK